MSRSRLRRSARQLAVIEAKLGRKPNGPDIRFFPAEPSQAARLAVLIYESSHELLDFMFSGRARAEAALTKLLQQPGGHFGHRFATVMLADDEIGGVVLGYDRKQLVYAHQTTGNFLQGAFSDTMPVLSRRFKT